MLQFLAWIVRLLGVNYIPIEADKYPLEGLTKWSVEEFRNPLDMMLHNERVKQISNEVSMGGYSLSTLVKIKSVFKLSNT